jgi:hypothetical protein
MKSVCINVRTSSRLSDLIEGNQFPFGAFEDRIDPGRKQSVIQCFKLRDLRPQPVCATFAVWRSFHNHVVRPENCASAASKQIFRELGEIGMDEVPTCSKARVITVVYGTMQAIKPTVSSRFPFATSPNSEVDPRANRGTADIVQLYLSPSAEPLDSAIAGDGPHSAQRRPSSRARYSCVSGLPVGLDRRERGLAVS